MYGNTGCNHILLTDSVLKFAHLKYCGIQFILFNLCLLTAAFLLFIKAPKTPLQKSMDLLGKQLSLYSFGIIGKSIYVKKLQIMM